MNIFGYVRVSSLSQIDGDGFPRQVAALEAFCKAHKLEPCALYSEKGVSGTVEGLDRPAFAEMLQCIDDRAGINQPIGAIVVERMDRLARDLMVSEVLLMELRKRGIKVFAADQGVLIDMASDGGDPTRVLIRQIMGALAQWEKSMLVKKLRSAKDRLKAAGKFVEGNYPLGTKPGEQAILDVMLANHPAMNYSQIANLLNGGACLTRNGKPWSAQNVRSAIVNYRKRK